VTLLTLGWAAEYPSVAANCLWPQTVIATAAVQNLLGGEDTMAAARNPQIMADAAVLVLDSTESGHTYLDVDVLAAHGITEYARYGPTDRLAYDLFVDPPAS